MEYLKRINNQALDEYLQLVNSVKPIDIPKARELALAALRYYSGNDVARHELRENQELEKRWYKSLVNGEPDYTIYADDYFISDIWACWVKYSHKYVHGVKKIFKAAQINEIYDLGCGFGYTTAALKNVFPNAIVRGTNYKPSLQYDVCKKLGKECGFTIHDKIPDSEETQSLLFASEYFEHFLKPVDHLLEILLSVTPRYLVIANAFGATSIGHFPIYYDNRVAVPNKSIGRVFNSTLRKLGYVQVKTGFWNNRPNVWEKTSAAHP